MRVGVEGTGSYGHSQPAQICGPLGSVPREPVSVAHSLRIDTSSNELGAVIGFEDVEIPPSLIPEPLPRLEQEEFAERVLAAVRREVFAGGYTVDQWTGEAQQVPWHMMFREPAECVQLHLAVFVPSASRHRA